MNVPADSKVCTISTLDSAGMSQLILRFLAKAFSDSVGMLQLILRFLAMAFSHYVGMSQLILRF